MFNFLKNVYPPKYLSYKLSKTDMTDPLTSIMLLSWLNYFDNIHSGSYFRIV